MKKHVILALTVVLALTLVLAATGIADTKKGSENKNPYIGVYTQSNDEDVADAFDLPTDKGIVVVDIINGSPADEAGLEEGDVIIGFDGHDIDGSKALKDFVVDKNIGDKVTVVYMRGDDTKKTTIEIASRPEEFEKQVLIEKNGPFGYARTWMNNGEKSGYIGVSIQDLNEQLGDYFGVQDGNGVLVVEVMDDSPAAKAGLKAGDVVIGVDDQSIEASQDLQEYIAAKSEGDKVDVKLLRRGEKKTLSVEVAESEMGMNAFTFPNLGNFGMPQIFDKNGRFHFYGDSDFDDDNIVIRKGRFMDDDHDIIIHKNNKDDDDNDVYIRKMKRDNNDSEDIDQLKEELKSLRKELKEIKEKLD
ncbi:MAG: PDZ domain-containing protein [Candidatus Zixiibacteriota bacterium]